MRAFLRSDTLIEDRIAFDKQVLRDFYLSRGYVDFRVNSANVEFTREHDAFYLVVNVTEGQQYKFGKITTVSEMPGVDAAAYQKIIKVKSGKVYSPSLVEKYNHPHGEPRGQAGGGFSAGRAADQAQ
ncbi:POTRA domain-containing protein [Jhaorihella thermophila]